MTISIVNGYTCETSCDVAKAKAGQDPHPRITATARETAGAGRDGTSPVDSAVRFGGILAQIEPPTGTAKPDSASAATRPGAILDVSA